MYMICDLSGSQSFTRPNKYVGKKAKTAESAENSHPCYIKQRFFVLFLILKLIKSFENVEYFMIIFEKIFFISVKSFIRYRPLLLRINSNQIANLYIK